jgi:HSP20 family protein
VIETVMLSVAPTRWRPAADVCETDATVSVAVELAGVDEEDLEIELYPDALVVEGLRRPASFPPDGVYLQAEIRPGPFRLVVPMPSPVDLEGVQARYERGLLTIELPKATGR